MTLIAYERKVEIPPHSKISYPTIPVDHPDYQWTNGSDVQKTWARFGWKPLSNSSVETSNVR